MKFYHLLSMSVLAFSCLSIQAAESTKPNIVFILADDLGYGDVGFNGQKKIKTPHLDQLAKEGMVFSDFYSGSAVCGPSRATLMSGKHTGNCKIRANPRWTISDKAIDFDENDQTLGKVIKSAGYACGYFGKWGLNENLEAGTGHPNKQGFDEFWGFNTHREAHAHWPEYVWHNSKKIDTGGKDNWKEKKVYADDLFNEKAIEFIEENAGKKPFFAFLGYTIPHEGISAPRESWKQYENLGWPKKKGRVAHYRDDPDTNISYAAMISHMDAYVGQLKQTLKEKGVLDNTIIFFTSDNGHYYPDFFNSGGEFKGRKTWLWEGGIRMPTVVSWPNKIKAGSTLDKPFALWDVMETFAEITGATAPKGDGISFLPALLGEKNQKMHDYLYWEFNERNGSLQAVRFAGKWKGYREWSKKSAAMGPIQLYDLEKDPGETKNQASAYPELASQAEKILNTARTEDPAFPMEPKGKATPKTTKANPKAGKKKSKKKES